MDESLVEQYIRNERIVKEFTAYYDLYNKYKKDYQIDEILSGAVSEETMERAGAAAFDERLSLLGMLMDKVLGSMKENVEASDYLRELMGSLKAAGTLLEKEEGAGKDMLLAFLEKQIEAREKLLGSLEKANSLSEQDKRKHRRILKFLTTIKKEAYLGEAVTGWQAYEQVKETFNQKVLGMKEESQRVQDMLHWLFFFVERAFGEGNEMLILVTELTVNTYSARFIGMFGSEDYKKYNSQMMLSERQTDLKKEIAALEL